MSVIDHSTMSSDQRPVRLRARRDLVISRSVFQGEASRVVKDPVGMKYFQLREPEYLVLSLLDGNHSYRQITRELTRKFPEQKTRVSDVQQLVSSLHTSGLLVTDASGQATPLQKRRNKELKQKAMGLMSSIIAMKFPGVDPERFLGWLYPKVSWFFTPAVTLANFLIMAAAALLVLSNFSEFMRRMPEFQQFFGFNNLLFMGAILIVTKSIHELGHGLMCKHYGGECHEIGFMLLVMTPAMYCNTSDSWVLPNKWHRIAIGAGGMYVELVLASIATFIWWYTHPGWLHYLCLNIMFLSSVSTIVFNANPLLRYDGYYMLADYLEIPNLSQKSKQAMISKLRVWGLGMDPVNARMLPKRNHVSFAVYSVASFVYRWFVLLMIFWFLKEIFEPYGLAVIGQLLIAISLIGMVVMPAFKLVKFFLHPGRFREVKKVRTAVSFSLLAIAIWAFCFIPVPHYVYTEFVVRPANAQAIYVDQPGTLTECSVRPGDQVEKGRTIAVLENDDQQLVLLALQGRLAELQSDLAAYQLNRTNVAMDSDRMIGETNLQISSLKRQIAIREKDLSSLKLIAGRDGEIIPPPNQPSRGDDDGIALPSWTGTPLDAENRGALLMRETLFCYIGDSSDLKAELVVDQSDMRYLLPGQKVELNFFQYQAARIKSELADLSFDPLSELPRELSQTNGGSVAATPGPAGNEGPLLKSYKATVPLTDTGDLKLMPGFRGTAKIRVGSASLGKRMWRQIQTVVNFR